MIKGFDKLLKQEFNFPIMNAEKAVFRIVSVNEVKGDENKWYGVLGCRYIDNGIPYEGMPDYIVFTMEYKSGGRFNITGMITNKGSFTIDASISEIDTMDGFLNQLKRIASLFDSNATN